MRVTSVTQLLRMLVACRSHGVLDRELLRHRSAIKEPEHFTR